MASIKIYAFLDGVERSVTSIMHIIKMAPIKILCFSIPNLYISLTSIVCSQAIALLEDFLD
jgi:hypothetical protein